MVLVNAVNNIVVIGAMEFTNPGFYGLLIQSKLEIFFHGNNFFDSIDTLALTCILF